MHATPGGPWDRNERPLPQNVVDTLNAKYGLDKPIWEQYVIFLGQILHGDLGSSYSHYGQDVSTILISFFPVIAPIGAVAMLVALIGGLSLGLISGVNHNTSRDYLASLFLGGGRINPKLCSCDGLDHYFCHLSGLAANRWMGWHFFEQDHHPGHCARAGTDGIDCALYAF